MTRGLLVLALALSGASVASAQDTCGEHRLDGAADAAGHPEVTFVEGWRPALEELRACLDAAPADACLEIQGQFDDHTFPPAIERSLGSATAAQQQRARARASEVTSALAELGAPYGRLRERPPSPAPTFRGVLVRLVPGCLARPAEPATPEVAPATAVELPAWLSSPEALAAAIRVAQAAEVPAPAPSRGPWTVDGAASFGFSMAGESDAFSFAPRIAVGWGITDLYVRAFVGAGTADELEQRAFFEWGASIGGHPLPWWSIGATFTHRLGTLRVGLPLFEQTFFLGATTEQRVVDLGAISIWLHESISPLGLRYRRGAVEAGAPQDIPDRLDYAVRGEVMLVIRGHIDASFRTPR